MTPKFICNLKTKTENAIKSAIHKAAPVVKREIAKTVSNGTIQIKDAAFDIITAAGIIFAICAFSGITESVTATDDILRGVSMVYNEVKIENLTINLKGD